MRILICGAGGLGGFVAEALARQNHSLIIADGDSFDNGNLNRQLFADLTTLGKNKAEVTAFYLKTRLNCSCKAVKQFVTEDNANSLINGVDAVFDCIDNVEGKLLIEKICIEKDIVLIHGGVGGKCGQAAVITSPVLRRIYREQVEKQANDYAGAGLIACLMTSLFNDYQSALTHTPTNVKQGGYKQNTVYFLDFANYELTAVEMG